MYRVEETPELFARQLGIKPGSAVAALNAPQGFVTALTQGLPPGAGIAVGRAISPEGATVVLLWPRNMHELLNIVAKSLKDGSSPFSALWVVIPKKPVAQRTGSDLFFQEVLARVLPTGLVDNKTLTFSEEEYGIRFVPRRRKEEKQRDGGTK